MRKVTWGITLCRSANSSVGLCRSESTIGHPWKFNSDVKQTLIYSIGQLKMSKDRIGDRRCATIFTSTTESTNWRSTQMQTSWWRLRRVCKKYPRRGLCEGISKDVKKIHCRKFSFSVFSFLPRQLHNCESVRLFLDVKYLLNNAQLLFIFAMLSRRRSVLLCVATVFTKANDDLYQY